MSSAIQSHCAHVCFVSFCTTFFFQAEDGIRDLTVTGVQTCALPIYPIHVVLRAAGDLSDDHRGLHVGMERAEVSVGASRREGLRERVVLHEPGGGERDRKSVV